MSVNISVTIKDFSFSVNHSKTEGKTGKIDKKEKKYVIPSTRRNQRRLEAFLAKKHSGNSKSQPTPLSPEVGKLKGNSAAEPAATRYFLSCKHCEKHNASEKNSKDT